MKFVVINTNANSQVVVLSTGRFTIPPKTPQHFQDLTEKDIKTLRFIKIVAMPAGDPKEETVKKEKPEPEGAGVELESKKEEEKKEIKEIQPNPKFLTKNPFKLNKNRR